MAEAQLRSYHPTFRDQIASWLLGDSRPSVERRAFVEGLLGSSGLGTKGGSLSDFTPPGMLFSAQDAKRSFDNGAYGAAAWDVLGAVPGGVVTGVIKQARKAVRPLEDVIGKAFGGTLERAADDAVRVATRRRTQEKTGLIRAQQQQGYSPDEIRQALAAFDGTGASPRQGTEPRLAAAEPPRVADALPALDEAAATERVRAAHEMPPATLDDWVNNPTDDLDYGELLDRHILKHYDNGPSEWVGPFGLHEWRTITQPYRRLKDAGVRDAHHILQDAAARELPGYDKWKAPAIQFDGPSNFKGTPHYKATQVQREPGGGTLGAELPFASKSLKAREDLDEVIRAQAMWELIQYLKFLNLKSDTPTRIPGDRRKPK